VFFQLYREQVRNGLRVKDGIDPITHCALGLAGEAGEVADLIKKEQYEGQPPLDKEKMLLELGDALWYLSAIADRYDWSLETVATANIGKLAKRHPSRGYSIAGLFTGQERYDTLVESERQWRNAATTWAKWAEWWEQRARYLGYYGRPFGAGTK
jgi:NTP pyrophosphatase (non-canonical NTP hydrolase)